MVDRLRIASDRGTIRANVYHEECGMEIFLWVIFGVVLIWFISTLDKINDNLRDIKELLEKQQPKD